MNIELNDIVVYNDMVINKEKYGRVVEILEVQRSINSDYEGGLVYKVLPIDGLIECIEPKELRNGFIKVYKEVK